MVSSLVIILALTGCNPPIDMNEGPAIKFQTPTNGDTRTQNEAIPIEIRLVDRDGEGPMTLSVTSSIDGELGQVDGMLNFDVATFTIENPLAGPHTLTAVSTDDEGASQTRSIDFVVNAAPNAPTLIVTPEEPTTVDNLYGDIDGDVTDPEGSPLIHLWEWMNLDNGATFDGQDFPAIIDSSFTERGQQWTFSVTTHEAVEVEEELRIVTDGNVIITSRALTIANSLPTAPSGVAIDQTAPSPIDDLTCSLGSISTDADEDLLTYLYSWEHDDNGSWTVVGSGETLSATFTDGGGTYRCSVAADDGIGLGLSSTSVVTVGPATDTVNSAHTFISGSGADRYLGSNAVGARLGVGTPADLILGLPDLSDFASNGGWLAVFSGLPASGSDELDATRSVGGVSDSQFGAPLVPIKDATGDAIPDLLVGGSGDPGLVSPIVLLIPGESLSQSHTVTDEAGFGFVSLFHGDPLEEAGFGFATTGGDFDGNGEADVVVTQVRDGKKNQVFLFSDQDLNPNTSVTTNTVFRILSAEKEDDFGEVLASGDDCTGDGVDDLIISNPSQTDGKAVYVFDGTQLGVTDLIAGNAVVRISVDGAYKAGQSLALGDISGDGVADIVIGAPEYDGTGAVFVFYGGATLNSTPDLVDADLVIYGTNPDDKFGEQVQILPNRGNDSTDELLVSAPGADAASGTVYAFLGAKLAVTAGSYDADQADMLVLGDDTGDALSLSGPLGDMDGDNRADWLVTSPTHGDIEANEGRVYVFLSGN